MPARAALPPPVRRCQQGPTCTCHQFSDCLSCSDASAVYIHRNKLDGAVCLSIILTLLMWLPGDVAACATERERGHRPRASLGPSWLTLLRPVSAAGVLHAIWVILNGKSVRAVQQLEDATEALIPDL